jgi:hypothetical protein
MWHHERTTMMVGGMTMKRILAICGVGALALASLPAPALGSSEVKPLTTNDATEWRLGTFGGPGSTERPATLYEVQRCVNVNYVCPGVVVIFWTSQQVATSPTVIQTISNINHVYRTGLNTYRLAVTTGSAGPSCNSPNAPAYCAHALHDETLQVNTWTRTVTGAGF